MNTKCLANMCLFSAIYILLILTSYGHFLDAWGSCPSQHVHNPAIFHCVDLDMSNGHFLETQNSLCWLFLFNVILIKVSVTIHFQLINKLYSCSLENGFCFSKTENTLCFLAFLTEFTMILLSLDGTAIPVVIKYFCKKNTCLLFISLYCIISLNIAHF